VEWGLKKGATERLCAFLPPDVRRGIFGLLLASYGDEKRLAEDIGCSLSSLREWVEEGGHAPSDKHMPIILSLALADCPEVGNLLRKELLEAVERLCADLGISQKAKKGDLSLLMDALDEKSREILWHLWWHRHAQLDELAELIGASTDMEVLFRLREVINPVAERILGKPILEFSESRVDPVTGEKVLFSWWLGFDGSTELAEVKLTTGLEGQPLGGRRGGPLVDLFDEKDHIMIIAELPPSVRLRPEGLRPEWLAKKAEVAYKNGILKIKLAKR